MAGMSERAATPALPPLPVALCCPICAQEQKRVRLVPLGQFFIHEEGTPRARRCHATTFTGLVAQAAANQHPEQQEAGQ